MNLVRIAYLDMTEQFVNMELQLIRKNNQTPRLFLSNHFLPSATVVEKGYVFTCVCTHPTGTHPCLQVKKRPLSFF